MTGTEVGVVTARPSPLLREREIENGGQYFERDPGDHPRAVPCELDGKRYVSPR